MGNLRAVGRYHVIESIFIGAAMVATSVGITAQVLASRGLLQHARAQVILAAAVIDDVLGLIVLALVSGLARGQSTTWMSRSRPPSPSVSLFRGAVRHARGAAGWCRG